MKEMNGTLKLVKSFSNKLVIRDAGLETKSSCIFVNPRSFLGE